MCAETSEAVQRFRATPLVKLNFVPNPDTHGTLGINGKGQVVYGYITELTNPLPPMHAWLWTPGGDPNYASPLDQAGFHDLTDVYEHEGPEIARDINDIGHIVGQDGTVELQQKTDEGNIALWTVTSLDFDDTFGTLPSGTHVSIPWAGATAINNESEPLIVGISSIENPCQCNGQDLANRYAGFSLRLDSSPSLEELENTGQRNVTVAYDVNNYFDVSVSGVVPRIVGHVDCFFPQNSFCQFRDPIVNCDSAMYPGLWIDGNPTPTTMSRVDSNDNAEARGINDDNKAVGWGKYGSLCQYHAAFWTNSTTVVDLHDGLLPSDRESRAEAVNNATNPQIAGWEIEEADHALLWEFDGSNWSVLHLDSSDGIGEAASIKFELFQAHDINDSEWIVCWGMWNSEPWAFVLTPYTEPQTCAADVNGDGSVNVLDLLAVINAWGDCIGYICGPADINTDSSVGVPDILAVIEHWGSCENPPFAPPETVEDCESDCAQQYPGGGQDYIDCVASCVRALCNAGKLPPEDCP